MSISVQYQGNKYVLVFEYRCESNLDERKVFLSFQRKRLTEVMHDKRDWPLTIRRITTAALYHPLMGQETITLIPCIVDDVNWEEVKGQSVWEYRQNRKNDSYDKELGRKLALTECLKLVPDKGLRTAIWEAYRAQCRPHNAPIPTTAFNLINTMVTVSYLLEHGAGQTADADVRTMLEDAFAEMRGKLYAAFPHQSPPVQV